jgi:hypothetical protein
MKLVLRIISFTIAMLIAGREALAFGSALSATFDLSWSEEGNPINDSWLLECEGAEECDDQEDEFNDDSPSHFESCRHDSRYSEYFCLISGTSKFDFLLRSSEFYIYVLNLRL